MDIPDRARPRVAALVIVGASICPSAAPSDGMGPWSASASEPADPAGPG